MRYSMGKICKCAEDIVAIAEMDERLYEVEVSVLVRRNSGEESDFIRMQLDRYDGERQTRQLTVKNFKNSNQWF